MYHVQVGRVVAGNDNEVDCEENSEENSITGKTERVRLKE